MSLTKKQVLSIKTFGNDYHLLIERSAVSSPPHTRVPWYSDTKATIFPTPILGSQGISATLLDRLTKLSQSSWRGIPYDHVVMEWMRRHLVEMVVRDGSIAIAKNWRLCFEHGGARHPAMQARKVPA